MKHIIPLKKTQMKEKLGGLDGGRENQASEANGQQRPLLLLHPSAAAKQSPQRDKEKQVQADLKEEFPVPVEQHLAPGPQGHPSWCLLMVSLSGEQSEHQNKDRIDDGIP